jgi:hypothetical protein
LSEHQAAALGIRYGPVPDSLYAHLPNLPHGRGVLVTEVRPESPAAQAGLRRYDIVLSYEAEPPAARRSRAAAGERPVRLTLVRGGRELTVPVPLGPSPVRPARPELSREAAVSRGEAKSSGPASVTVAVTPLDGGRMAVTFEYVQEGTGKLGTVTCSGTPGEIDKEVHKLPARVQDLARVALERIRALEAQKDSGQRTPVGRSGP